MGTATRGSKEGNRDPQTAGRDVVVKSGRGNAVGILNPEIVQVGGNYFNFPE